MSTSSLDTWRTRFTARNWSPWPGPQPMKPSSDREGAFAGQLIGREREVHELVLAAGANDLLIVTGQSGVGKTSTMRMGFETALVERGMKVIVCDDWAGVDATTDPGEYVLRHGDFDEVVPSDLLGSASDTSTFDRLDLMFPNQIVLVLDQLEEAIRSSPAFAHRLVDWIGSVVGHSSATFVLSLRSEHEHELSELRTSSFIRRRRFELQPIIDPDIIEEIIESARTSRDDHVATRPRVSVEAQAELRRLWIEACDRDAWGRPGLLHLQATLYALWMGRSPDDPEADIDLADVEQLRAEAVAEGESVFERGLVVSVKAAVRNCRTACDEDSQHPGAALDPALAAHVESLVEAVAEHLASGGYKVPKELGGLASLVLPIGQHVATLGPNDKELVAHTVQCLNNLHEAAESGTDHVDWLDVTRSELGLPPGGRPSNKSSGPARAAGLSDVEIIIEHHRAFLFALEWLRAGNIVRFSPWGQGSRAAVLVHDRFSVGLEQWKDELEDSPDRWALGYSAIRGRDLVWTPEHVGESFGVTGRSPAVISNVRWESCTIKARFTNVLFVNCDFRGSTFRECDFVGATFVNCVLDNVDFVGCTVHGAAEWPDYDVPVDMVEVPPTYVIEADASSAASLSRLAETDETFTALHSVPSPRRASPMTAAGAAEVELPYEACLPTVNGGLTMCAGRLSSLMFRKCTFEIGAVVSLRHIAGTSLEICEQDHGTFDIYAAAIRGLTVTRPTGNRPVPAGSANRRLAFAIRESKVINAWFGVGLVGEAVFEETKVWQLLNAGDRPSDSSPGFEVSLDSVQYCGLINTAPPADSGEAGFGRPDLGSMRDDVRRVSESVDYSPLDAEDADAV